MIPVGTSVNPGELRSGPKWEKTFILYPLPPTLSLKSTHTQPFNESGALSVSTGVALFTNPPPKLWAP